jgi:hypothetical protein
LRYERHRVSLGVIFCRCAAWPQQKVSERSKQ